MGNDIHDNIALAEKVPVGGNLVSRERAWFYGHFPGSLVLHVKSSLLQSHLYRLVFRRLRGLDIPDPMDDAPEGRPGKAATPEEQGEEILGMYRKRLAIFMTEGAPPWVEMGWSKTRGYLSELARLLGERGIPVVLFVIPEHFQINPDLCRSVLERAPEENRHLVVWDLPQRRLQALCEEAGIILCDLLEPFLAAGLERRLYHAGNAHWNVEGNLLAGRLLFDFLRRKGLLRASLGSR